MAYVWATDRLPLWSRSTARYSTSVPLARPVTSWKTRYGALSSVPSAVHAVGARRAPGERHLVEAAVGHRHADLGPATDGVAGARRAEVHRRRVLLWCFRSDVGPPHDGAQRRHGDRDATLAVAADVAVPAGHRPRNLPCSRERVERDRLVASRCC